MPRPSHQLTIEPRTFPTLATVNNKPTGYFPLAVRANNAVSDCAGMRVAARKADKNSPL